jgi:hypothetical protein
MKAIIKNDLVIGQVAGNAAGPDIPEDFLNTKLETLRYIDGEFKNIQDFSLFYIDQSGIKHVVKYHDDWQELECHHSDSLVRSEDENWYKKTNEDVLREKKSNAVQKITAFANQCRRQVAGDVDHLETAEWSEKRLRALRILNDQVLLGDIEKIEIEALYREKGETVEELVTKITANANRYENASIIITGMTAAAIEATNKATIVEEIDALLGILKDKANIELAKL